MDNRLIFEILFFIFLGAFTGAAAALLGIGGGIIIVPVLSIVFSYDAFPADKIMHYAIGTSLCIMIFTSTSSLVAHSRKGNVLWAVFFSAIPGISAGVLLGVLLAHCMQSFWLSIIFGILLLAVAFKMFLGLSPKEHDNPLPRWYVFSGGGGIIGLVAGLLGIGGGPLSVPFLSYFRMEMKKAVGTSSALTLPIALLGTATVLVSGWDRVGPPYSLSYIYLPALAGIAPFSVLAAPLGAKLADRLPSSVLRKAFAVLLVIISLKMLMIWHLIKIYL